MWMFYLSGKHKCQSYPCRLLESQGCRNEILNLFMLWSIFKLYTLLMLPIAINCLYIFTTLYTLFSHRLLLSVLCLCFEKNRNCLHMLIIGCQLLVKWESFAKETWFILCIQELLNDKVTLIDFGHQKGEVFRSNYSRYQ